LIKLFDKDVEIKAMLSILASPDNLRLKLLNRIGKDHFGFTTIAQIYKVLSEVLARSEALPNIETFCSQPGLPDNTVELLLTQEAITTEDSVEHLIDLLDYYKRIRKLVLFQTKTAESMNAVEDNDSLDVISIMNDMEKALLEMRKSASEESKMCHFGVGFNCQELLDSTQSKELTNIIPSTFQNFDSKVKGFGKNDLLFVASIAKGCKSILALNICIQMYLKNNKSTLFITLEMPKEEVHDRLCSNITGISYKKIREKRLTQTELELIKKAELSFIEHGKNNNCRFTIWSPANFTLRDLRLLVKPMKYSVICIDYINLISGFHDKMAKHEKLDEASRILKSLTTEMDTFFIVPAQMNQDKTGGIADIRYSKALKEHATNIWAWDWGEAEKGKGFTTIKQLMARGWEPFSFKLKFEPDSMKISDYDGTSQESFEDVADDGEDFD
jgi:replicative DNA helicase